MSELIKDFEQISIVEDLKGSKFETKVNDIWSFAETEIHPFQKGDSHQASLHCLNVLNYISLLLENKPNIRDTEKFLLVIGAILHDLDKAIINYESEVVAYNEHGIRSAKFIRAEYDRFKLELSEARAVAFIAEHHGQKGFKDIAEGCFTNYQLDSENNIFINLAKLAALFKLADMMDITYKRISKIIIALNFPEGCDNPKLISRQMFYDCNVKGLKCVLNANDIETPQQYQSILIAIDMMNEELIETGAKDLLYANGFPYQFDIGTVPITNSTVKEFKKQRDKISFFDSDSRLVINKVCETDIIKIYDRFEGIIKFSSGELRQLKTKSKTVYSKATLKDIKDIAKKLKRLFGYSIDQILLTRQFSLDGRSRTFIDFIGIKKPKELCITFTYSIIEESVKAIIKREDCSITEKLDEKHTGHIELSDKDKCRFTWPGTDGFEYIERLQAACEVKNAWAVNKDILNDFYPGNTDPHEYFDYDMVYPVCQLKIELQFPPNYHIQPVCEYTIDKTKYYLEVQHDPIKNVFSFEHLNQDEMSAMLYPKYRISWIVPDRIQDSGKCANTNIDTLVKSPS